MNNRTLARGLAWFGIGLGVAELLAPRRVAEAAGLEGHERTIRLFGVREIASGVAILATREPERNLGLRVAGDLLDGGLLSLGLRPGHRGRARTGLAALAIAPMAALDTAVWLRARNGGDRPQQIPIDRRARADDPRADAERGDGTHEIAPDIAYQRLLMVNVVFVGPPGAGDRGWVLVDTGVPGTKNLIKHAAHRRFGAGARPSAIVLTHGHFDHVGVLADLAREWDVPVYAHALETPYLDGSASYPPGDPTVGGGAMALLSPLFPTKPVDVSSRLKVLPEDGSIPAMPGWRWIHTPGHAPGHVSLWREGDRSLIAGDAFVTTASESAYANATQAPEIHGPPKYFTIDWEAARRSVETLAGLAPERAITGHGRAMRGESMRRALTRLAERFDQLAVPPRGRYVASPVRAQDGSAGQEA